MDQRLKEWFCHKAEANPGYLINHYLPGMEREIEKAHAALHEAERKGDMLEIKYRVGRFDGVQEVLNFISGLRMSESRPQEAGLVSRSLDYGRQLLKQASRQ